MDRPAPTEIRPGEIAFAFDPGTADDARLAFIGRIDSQWTTRADCPKNIREARERKRPATLILFPPFRPALAGLERGQWATLLTWLDGARRDLAVQAPRHAERPRGTFSLRSPVRPNPIGLHLVRLVSIEMDGGRIALDAIDVLNGTPVLDLKPFLPGVDVPPPEA